MPCTKSRDSNNNAHLATVKDTPFLKHPNSARTSANLAIDPRPAVVPRVPTAGGLCVWCVFVHVTVHAVAHELRAFLCLVRGGALDVASSPPQSLDVFVRLCPSDRWPCIPAGPTVLSALTAPVTVLSHICAFPRLVRPQSFRRIPVCR